MEQQGILCSFIRGRARGRLVLVRQTETGDVPERRSPALPRGAAASSGSGLRSEQEGVKWRPGSEKVIQPILCSLEKQVLAQTDRSTHLSQDIKHTTAAQPRDAANPDLMEILFKNRP